MRHRVTLLAAACAALAHAAPLTLRWTAEASDPKPYEAQIMRGETVALQATLRAYGQPVDLAGATATFYWQTNGMQNAWWSAPALAGGPTVTATWTPLCDVGAAQYTFYIAASDPGGVLYRAYGTLRMRPSPGFNPATLPPPQSIDYATRDWVGAQGFLTAADLPAPAIETDPTVPAATNALMAAASDRFQPKGNYLTAYTETDPTVPAWAKQPVKPAYTAAEVGAATASDIDSRIRSETVRFYYDSNNLYRILPGPNVASDRWVAISGTDLNAANTLASREWVAEQFADRPGGGSAGALSTTNTEPQTVAASVKFKNEEMGSWWDVVINDRAENYPSIKIGDGGFVGGVTLTPQYMNVEGSGLFTFWGGEDGIVRFRDLTNGSGGLSTTTEAPQTVRSEVFFFDPMTYGGVTVSPSGTGGPSIHLDHGGAGRLLFLDASGFNYNYGEYFAFADGADQITRKKDLITVDPASTPTTLVLKTPDGKRWQLTATPL